MGGSQVGQSIWMSKPSQLHDVRFVADPARQILDVPRSVVPRAYPFPSDAMRWTNRHAGQGPGQGVRPQATKRGHRDQGTQGRDRVTIEHDGQSDEYLCEVLVRNPAEELEQHPRSTVVPGWEMLTTRDLPVRLIEESPAARSTWPSRTCEDEACSMRWMDRPASLRTG